MDHELTDRTQDLPSSFEEMRGAQRFTLLIRTAKLVSESGEFLCVIRDVSATGVRLKLFHDLTAGRHLALELANGEVYFIETVWERDGHAGFRFSAPIDVHAFIEEVSPYPRRQIRLRMEFPALVSSEGEAAIATVRDISQQGARIETARHLAIGQRVKLEAEGLPPVIARVCWRAAPEFGLAFEQVFSLEQLARVAARLQLSRGKVQNRTANYA
jgi:PilZ domain